jgi:hypothetical protein
LDMGGCYLSDMQVSQLLTALTGHAKLKTLILTLNSCHEQGSQALGKLLQHPDCKLSKLNVSHQRDDRQDFDEQQQQQRPPQPQKKERVRLAPLAEALAVNTSLIHLKLGRNRLRDSDIQPLVNVLKSNTTLKTLDLNNNAIQMPGVESIGQALPHWKGVEKLLLMVRSESNISGSMDAKSSSLVTGMEGNTTMKVLQLPESFPGRKQVLYWCAMNKAGRHLLHKEGGVPTGLWTHVLAKSTNTTTTKIATTAAPLSSSSTSPFHNDSLYHLLRQGVLHR